MTDQFPQVGRGCGVQGPGDGVGGGLHAGHEEDGQLAPQPHKRQRLARPVAHTHQERPYREVLLHRPHSPGHMPHHYYYRYSCMLFPPKRSKEHRQMSCM